MKTSEVLRKAAERCERLGFSAELGSVGGCGCFVAHLSDADGSHVLEFLRETIFMGTEGAFSGIDLRREGWTTPDAVAALNMAADIAECDGL